MSGKRYWIYTYGCQMNVHESEKLASILQQRGYQRAEDVEQADVIVFNTCCIRESAELRILGNIGSVKPLKKKNPNLVVAVCGCMSQQQDMEATLKKKFPFINIIFGANNVEFFGDYLDLFLEQRKYQAQILSESSYQTKEQFSTLVRDSQLHAFVNIMYGCNNFCSYCIVPYVRGREKSRKPEDIYAEVRSLLALGNYKVITLLGQNVNSYGNDFSDKSVNFPKLLETIANFEGDFELRFMTSHPKDLSDELIEVIARNPKISKAIHLPVQSGSNSVLKSMNRGYTVEDYLTLVKKIYARIPGVSLSTDIIVGFVGETEQDFMQTVALLEEVKFNNAFIFMYSKRKGTAAEKMDGHLSLEVKRQRIHKLLEVQKRITNERFKSLIGKTERVLVEEEGSQHYISKLQCGKVAKIVRERFLPVGQFATVRITDYKNGNLYAEVV